MDHGTNSARPQSSVYYKHGNQSSTFLILRTCLCSKWLARRCEYDIAFLCSASDFLKRRRSAVLQPCKSKRKMNLARSQDFVYLSLCTFSLGSEVMLVLIKKVPEIFAVI